jgi:hypothetical protein
VLNRGEEMDAPNYITFLGSDKNKAVMLHDLYKFDVFHPEVFIK